MRLLLKRLDGNEKQTIGKLYALGEYDAVKKEYFSLELPWLDNATNISCIPLGEYKVTKRWSNKFKHHFHVQDVEGRSYILIHAGNFYTDIEGCILVGMDLKDLDKDGFMDVKDSGDAMEELLKIMPDEFTLTIIEQ